MRAAGVKFITIQAVVTLFKRIFFGPFRFCLDSSLCVQFFQSRFSILCDTESRYLEESVGTRGEAELHSEEGVSGGEVVGECLVG